MNYDFECTNPDCGWTGNRYANLKVCPVCRAPVQRMMTVAQTLEEENKQLRAERDKARLIAQLCVELCRDAEKFLSDEMNLAEFERAVVNWGLSYTEAIRENNATH